MRYDIITVNDLIFELYANQFSVAHFASHTALWSTLSACILHTFIEEELQFTLSAFLSLEFEF